MSLFTANITTYIVCRYAAVLCRPNLHCCKAVTVKTHFAVPLPFWDDSSWKRHLPTSLKKGDSSCSCMHDATLYCTAQGYSLLDALRSVTDPAQRQQGLEDAAGPLFRAAADLAASGAATGRESFVGGLLGVLATEITGSYTPEGPEVRCLIVCCVAA